ncbi:MAG: thioredoxin family protein [Spirochaetales bacterium]|nr:thioredoxin family protein [Spirochaetales bacterium]
MKRKIIISILLITTSFILFSQGMNSDSMNEHPDSGGIEDFSDLEDAQNRAESGPVVLFFYADWCPSCRTAMRSIRDGRDQLKDLTILIVNYDKSAQLKRKYGVTYQHTFVQINPAGESLSTWNGGDLQNIFEHVQREEMR